MTVTDVSRKRWTIAEQLVAARRGLHRLTPAEARAAWAAGAVVVDIRPAAQRAEQGELPGALLVERNVLEWRFDPTSEAALPDAAYDLEVIVICQEGYTSSLAASALQDLGVTRATDVIGGYAAWSAELGQKRDPELLRWDDDPDHATRDSPSPTTAAAARTAATMASSNIEVTPPRCQVGQRG